MSLNDYYESLDQMAATLAHEVKNPLSIVRANIDYLELSSNDKQFEKNYKIMRSELNRVNTLLQDIICFNMPISDAMALVDFEELIGDLVEELRSSCKTTSIKLYMPRNLLLRCDAEKLRRSLLNLIKNSIEAIEAADRKDGIIKITVLPDFDSTKLMLSIEDNGIGLTSDELQRLKNPFFTTKSNGSGLGFHIASNIIKEHGGTIELESVKNVGCKSIITLPIVDANPN